MKRELFLDTSFAVAAASERDQHHPEAVHWTQRLHGEQIRLVTTRAVLLEIGNALARPALRLKAAAYLAAVEQDPAVTVMEVTQERFAPALRLYRERPDKAWGLIDCLSL